MRLITLLSCCVLSLVAPGCAGSPPETAVESPAETPSKPAAGSQFTVTLSSPQGSNASVGTYEMVAASGYYGYGVSVINAVRGDNPAANHAPCEVLGATFWGKPEAGKQWPLLPPKSDGSANTTPGTATLVYLEACPDVASKRYWASASGAIRIDSVSAPDPRTIPAGVPADSLKTVTLTLLDVKMVPAPKEVTATGTFTLQGEGRIALMAGMDQP